MSESNKWISVKDKLPKDDTDVLVLICETEPYRKNGEYIDIFRFICTGWCRDNRWATNYCFGYKFVDEEEKENADLCTLEVTHWRPLPLLPEKIKSCELQRKRM